MNAVELVGVQKRYGRFQALKGLDMQVPTGSIYALLGPNGAGKSTALGILLGWIRSNSGTVRVLDTDARHLHRLRGRVAALPQDARFPDGLSLERQLFHYGRLMELDRATAQSEAHRVLELVGLRDDAKMRANELSHGMAKRVGIAQAFIGSPDLVVLDEPTAGLDPLNAKAIRDLIRQGAGKSTLIVSSHNLSEIQDLCTHGAILMQGIKVQEGTIAEMTRRGEELLVRFRGDSAVALRALEGRFGASAARSVTAGQLSLRFPSGTDSAVALRDACISLWEAGVAVEEVTQGTSLEAAFIEMTSGNAAGAAP